MQHNFSLCVRCSNFQALYFMMVFIGEKNRWGPSSGKLESKNTSFFVLASCRSCVLHNVLVARIRNNFSQNILCTNFLTLYFMMVFIGENTGGGHLVAS